MPCGKTNFAGILFIKQRENLTDSTNAIPAASVDLLSASVAMAT